MLLRSQGCRSNIFIHGKKGLDEACKEEKERYTEECGDCLDPARCSKSLSTVANTCTHTRAATSGITALSELRTVAFPLLHHQSRGEDADKTENQTEGP